MHSRKTITFRNYRKEYAVLVNYLLMWRQNIQYLFDKRERYNYNDIEYNIDMETKYSIDWRTLWKEIFT